MPAYLVFNELSAEVAAPDLTTAKKCLDGFSQVVLDGRIAERRTLVTPPQFIRMHIAVGYSVGRWVAEYADPDRERRQRLKLLVDRSIEYATCIPDNDLQSAEVEYRCMGREARGLATALLADGLAVSLWSDERWNVPSLDVEKSWTGLKDVETEVRPVPHACQTAQLDIHTEWLGRTRSPLPANGFDLWQEKAALFPSLDFCDSVEEQLRSLGGTDRRFKAAMRALQDLQNYCMTWATGYFDVKALIRASGESATTLQMYSEERKFRCPDGKLRLFQWHLKRDDSTRIYFIDLPERKRILVGYVGPHLRIASE